jgi:hypothetical protein
MVNSVEVGKIYNVQGFSKRFGLGGKVKYVKIIEKFRKRFHIACYEYYRCGNCDIYDTDNVIKNIFFEDDSEDYLLFLKEGYENYIIDEQEPDVLNNWD